MIIMGTFELLQLRFIAKAQKKIASNGIENGMINTMTNCTYYHKNFILVI
jgi:hypothetical protein